MAKKKKTEIVEVVAKCDNFIPETEIENMIFSIRGIHVNYIYSLFCIFADKKDVHTVIIE